MLPKPIQILLMVSVVTGCAEVHYTRGHLANREGDYEKARSQYLAAANRGSPEAQNALGILYFQGKGVKRDSRKAFNWFKRAAENGSAHGQYNLGRMYYFGLGGFRDKAAARRWYEKAKKSERLPGTVFRDAYMTTSDGFQRPTRKSDFLYYSQLPNPSIDLREGLLARDRGDHKSAYPYFLVAANEGSVAAQHSLGILFLHGNGVKQDFKAAAQWFTRAAQGKYAPSQYNLGRLYYFGWGVPQNEAAARYWYQQAHSSGTLLGTKNQPMTMISADGFRRPTTKADFPYYSETREAKIARGQTGTAPKAETALTTPKSGVPGATTSETPSGLAERTDSPTGPAVSPKTPKKRRPSQRVAKRDLSPSEIFKKAEVSVYQIVAAKSLNHARKREFFSYGSAVAISNYRAFTNCHVLAGAGIAFIFRDQPRKIGIVKTQRQDLSTDRCIITTDIKLKPVQKIQRSKHIVPGQRVYAIGNPQGLTNTISEGIVSGLRKRGGIRLIQTTAAISPGSSGGGLFDAKGRLVGITTMFRKDSQNLNFAIAAEEFQYLGK